MAGHGILKKLYSLTLDIYGVPRKIGNEWGIKID